MVLLLQAEKQQRQKADARRLDLFRAGSLSERQFAVANGVQRTSFQRVRYRAEGINLPKATVRFFTSEEGLEFLHQLQVSAVFELHECGNASFSVISAFWDRAQLSCFIGASESSLQRVAVEAEGLIAQFGRAESSRLGKLMPRKTISMAEDETFFPGSTCLVGIETVTNYILVECLADNRKSETWDAAATTALADLPVTVELSVSDEGKNIIKHTQDCYGGHHSPDLFHTQQELTRAASAQLELRCKRAKERLEEADRKIAEASNAKQAHETLEKKPRGRPKDFAALIDASQQDQAGALQEVRACEQNQKRFHGARHSITENYHPYDLRTGLRRTTEVLGTALDAAFNAIGEATQGMGESAGKRVAKAKKQVAAMKATMAFYFTTITLLMDSMKLDDSTRGLMEDILIPAFYLQRVARSTRDKSKKREIQHVSNDLLADFGRRCGPFAKYSESRLRELEQGARDCANRFQRSSSCTEGRNGQLSMHHHTQHGISVRRLEALTVIHNFDTRRDDGSTPASRFFEHAHLCLFTYLLRHMALPKRPRNRAGGMRSGRS